MEFNQKEFEEKIKDLSFRCVLSWRYKSHEKLYYYPHGKYLKYSNNVPLGYKNPVQNTFVTYINNITIEITNVWFRDGEEYQKISIIDTPKYADMDIDYLLYSFETENLGELIHYLYDQYDNNKQIEKERRQKEKEMKLNTLMEELG